MALTPIGTGGRIQTFNFQFVGLALYQLSYSGMVVVDGIEPPSRGLQPRATPSQLNDQMELPIRIERM